MLRVLQPSDYAVVPWKNGGGVTSDILVLPAGAWNDDFSLRVSLAPITVPGPFSSFPGIERHITLLSHACVELVFADAGATTLTRLKPFRFDSVLAPATRLPDGPANVLNVMTRRGVWTATVCAQDGAGAAEGDCVVLYAVRGMWSAASGTEAVSCPAGAAIVAAGAVSFAGTEDAEAVLAVAMRVKEMGTTLQ
jgi:environmental stress-induced protein Ves